MKNNAKKQRKHNAQRSHFIANLSHKNINETVRDLRPTKLYNYDKTAI